MTLTEGVITAIAGALGTSAWFWYDKKRTDKRIDDLGTSLSSLKNTQIEHANKFTSETQVREIVTTSIKSISEDIKEVKKEQKDFVDEFKEDLKQLTSLVNTLVVEIRVANGISEKLKKEK